MIRDHMQREYCENDNVDFAERAKYEAMSLEQIRTLLEELEARIIKDRSLEGECVLIKRLGLRGIISEAIYELVEQTIITFYTVTVDGCKLMYDCTMDELDIMHVLD